MDDQLYSFYDILTMIKDGNVPPLVKLHWYGESAIYHFDVENNCYLLEDEDKESDNFKFYLNESMGELDYMDKRFTIPSSPEKITIEYRTETETGTTL